MEASGLGAASFDASFPLLVYIPRWLEQPTTLTLPVLVAYIPLQEVLARATRRVMGTSQYLPCPYADRLYTGFHAG